MKIIFIIVLFILLGSLGYSLYLIYDNLPREPVELIINENKYQDKDNRVVPSEVIDKNKSVQFYPKLRFSEMPIEYSFDSECDVRKRENMKEAIEYFQRETLLEFRELGDDANADLDIICSDIAPEPEFKNHFIAGEGGPVEIINGTSYSVILKGKIALYRDERCSSAHISLHELLHALGFDHNNNPKSILYPTLECDQRVDDYLINEINKLYSVPSLPDLNIKEINATKAGKYLSFYIEIENKGLNKAKDVVLRIYDGDELIKEFSLEDVNVGVTKILTVENLKINRNSDKIVFRVESPDSELDESNNKAEFLNLE